MKKKFNFFLSALLVLLFGMELSTCSYALTTEITDEISEQIINFGIEQETNPTNLSILENINPSQFTSYFNSKVSLITGLEDLSQLFVIYSNNTFTFCTTNSTIGNSLNYAMLYMQSFNSMWCVNNTRRLSITCSSNSNPFSYTYDNDMNTEAIAIAYDDVFNYSFNDDLTVMTTNKILALGNITVIQYDNTYYILKPSVVITPDEPEIPDEPSGDISGNNSTGTITNPSGDTTGKVDLSGIENSLNNIENKIPTSGDIKDSQVQGNKEFWGNSEDINPEDFENELENNFNGIMENLSGELTQNQIFESLQGAEDGFLNFFKEEQNEEFYDLAFSWPDVEFMGGILIPAGGINISEMCREIPELGQLRSYIRVIFNFSVAICLIKQIYNLILSTLGIDNPYLYEDYDELTSINEDTGEYRQTAVRRKKIYNRRR